MSASGNTMGALKRTLRGNMSIDTRGGSYGSMDIGQSINQASAFFAKKDPKQKASNVKSSGFSKMHASFNVTNGLARSNDILVDSSSMNVNGGGTANIVNEALNFKLFVKLGGSYRRTSAFDLAGLLGGTIPVYVKGTFSNPKIEPDYGAITQAVAKSLLQKPVEGILKPGSLVPGGGKQKKLLPF